MDIEKFRKLLKAGTVGREVSTRLARRPLTSDIVQNLQHLVNRHNDVYGSHPQFCDAFRKYNIFMACVRPRRLEINEQSHVKLLRDPNFCEDLRSVLKAFRVGVRRSRFTSRQLFQDSVAEAGRDFELLSSATIPPRLETLDLKQEIGRNTVDSIIRRIYNRLSRPNRLSLNGGVVVASKTMHMIMPELFIMIDGRILKKLNEVSDYNPHPNDVKDWYNVIQRANYFGYKPNRLSKEVWDDNRYVIALMYYRRLILEWCEKNKSDIQGFLILDAKYGSTPSRIIDKALW